MSKFSSYAKRMNEIANATFAEYREKSDAVKSAESKYRAYPRRSGADPSYLAKSARAEADLAEANAQFEHCRRHIRHRPDNQGQECSGGGLRQRQGRRKRSGQYTACIGSVIRCKE